MADLKRDEIKYVRDLAKSSYQKDKECFICGTDKELQFHHFYSMTLLWEKWKRTHGIAINSVDDILVERENFKGDHFHEIYSQTVTLCKFHHMDRLHKIYGKVPALGTAEKQKRWCERQRIKYLEKNNNNVE
jgi:hypothetical protein